jgi:hypothetical protein
MPKTYKRRKAAAKASTRQARTTSSQVNASNTSEGSAASVSNSRTNSTNTMLANRAFFSPKVAGPQSLIMPAMVALGCWLMAYTLMFLTSDTNRYLIGGLAVLMAMLWTFSFGMRVRKLLIQRRPG